MNKKQLEKKYGIKIMDDSFYSTCKHRIIKAYKMYSADGCPWEKGLKNLKAVENECREWGDTLIRIKRRVEETGR